MLNHDMSQSVIVRSNSVEWQSSPSSTVRRKRFHLVGEPESGQVTSLVEYLPGSSFHRHEHPEGEEILVLSGIFSDEAGDWPAGSWLLNPEGFVHSPFSREGCLLFVKLRQYPGAEHLKLEWPNLVCDSKADSFTASHITERLENVFFRTLLQQAEESISIVTIGTDITLNPDAGRDASPGALRREYEGGVEGFVIKGTTEMNGELLNQHDWFRLPPGAILTLDSPGCTLYLKENSVIRLRSVN